MYSGLFFRSSMLFTFCPLVVTSHSTSLYHYRANAKIKKVDESGWFLHCTSFAHINSFGTHPDSLPASTFVHNPGALVRCVTGWKREEVKVPEGGQINQEIPSDWLRGTKGLQDQSDETHAHRPGSKFEASQQKIENSRGDEWKGRKMYMYLQLWHTHI